VGDPDAEPLVNLIDHPVAVPTVAADGIRTLRSALAGCRDEDLLRPAGQLERIRAYLEPVLVRKYESPGARMADLEQLTLLAQGYEARGRFLAEITLDPPASSSDLASPPLLDEDYLVLTTIHSAKGLEWDVVHVIHASDGNIPSDMATGDEDEIEEERRLLYVALTRARRSLHVTFPQRFHHTIRRERYSTALVSRFLDHDDVRETFERKAPDVDVREDTGAPLKGVASVDALLADLFG
jgi:DNA helicase-2/ATP-dependent DNA helicase PcrA